MARIVMVSGWAMSADILNPLAHELKSLGYDTVQVSLAEAAGESWEDLYRLVDSQLDNHPAVLVGWSLGGNLCTRFAAKFPEKVKALITLGSTPCFLASDNWPFGKHPDASREFADAVAADARAAMKEFAPVCARGSLDMKKAIRAFRASVKWALGTTTDWRELLNRLEEDARPQWQQVACPTHHILSDSDPLAKPELAGDFNILLPQHKVSVLQGCHGIFLDHPKVVAECIHSTAMEAE